MLSSAETIDIIAETLTTHQIPYVVLDPVRNLSLPWSMSYKMV
jgi:hydroxymethylpyrimidine/phosphomethylpyrimidine kinase